MGAHRHANIRDYDINVKIVTGLGCVSTRDYAEIVWNVVAHRHANIKENDINVKTVTQKDMQTY